MQSLKDKEGLINGPGIKLYDAGAYVSVEVDKDYINTLNLVTAGPGIATYASYQGGTVVCVDKIDAFQIKAPIEDSIMISRNGNVQWVTIENVFGELLKNPTVRDRVQNVINALNNLEMTVKLVKK